MQEHELNHNLVEHIFTSLHTKNQEQALQMAAEIRKFMDEMPGGFLIYHADGKEEIIYANLALLRIFSALTLLNSALGPVIPFRESYIRMI